MQLISFSPNVSLTLYNKQFTVVGIKPPDVVELRDADGDVRDFELENLIKQYELRNLRFPKPGPDRKVPAPEPARRVAVRRSEELSEKARVDGLAKKAYLDAIVRQGMRLSRMTSELKALLAAVTDQLGRKTDPSLSTLNRWYAQRLRGGDDTALLPYYARRGGPGKSRLPEATKREINRVIDNQFLSPERPSMRLCFDACIASIAEKNQWLPKSQLIRPPSYTTFVRFIRRRDGYEVTASRLGRRAAELQYRSHGKSTENYSLNECWEMDHTVLDIFVINPATGKPERPRVTVALEFVSRVPMGFDIDFSGTSAQASLNCIRHGILPKTYLRERYPEIVGDWPCYGAPRILKVDNGMEFHSKSFRHTCLDLGIELQYCATAAPWQKGRIERFLRTLNESMIGLPGSTGSHLYENKADIKPSANAVLNLPTLTKLIHSWILDDYLVGKHRGAHESA